MPGMGALWTLVGIRAVPGQSGIRSIGTSFGHGHLGAVSGGGELAAVPGADLGLLVFFGIGLLGGAHCLGMCGPLVTLYADRMESGSRRLSTHELRQHLLLNLGRTISYATIGAVMGAVGALVFNAAAIASAAAVVRGGVGIVVGIAIVGIGVGYITKGAMPSAATTGFLGARFSQVYATITGRVDSVVDRPGIVGLGMLHGLLPCPILYPAYLYAFARGSPLEGFLALGVLGLGTMPTLFAYGTAFQSLDAGTRTRLHRVLGMLFVVLGYLPIAMGLMALGISVPMPDIPFYQPLG